MTRSVVKPSIAPATRTLAPAPATRTCARPWRAAHAPSRARDGRGGRMSRAHSAATACQDKCAPPTTRPTVGMRPPPCYKCARAHRCIRARNAPSESPRTPDTASTAAAAAASPRPPATAHTCPCLAASAPRAPTSRFLVVKPVLFAPKNCGMALAIGVYGIREGRRQGRSAGLMSDVCGSRSEAISEAAAISQSSLLGPTPQNRLHVSGEVIETPAWLRTLTEGMCTESFGTRPPLALPALA
jgi:hypothetical protein